MNRKKFSKISDREFDKLIDEYDLRKDNNIFSDHYSKERILLKLLHDDKKVLKKKLKETEIQVTTLGTECALKDDTMKYLQSNLLERETKFRSMKDKTKMAVDMISEKMKKYTTKFKSEESNSDKNKYELEVEKMKLRITDLELQIKSLNRENFQYRRQLTQEKSSFELQEREYQNLVNEKREQLRVLHVSIEELKLRNEELLKERDVYHDFAKQYRMDKQDMINKYNEVVRVLKTKEKRLSKNAVKIKKLKESISYLHEGLDGTKLENRSLKRQMNKLTKQMRDIFLRRGGEGMSASLLKRITESTERIKVVSRKRIRNISAHKQSLKQKNDEQREEADHGILPEEIPRIVLPGQGDQKEEEEEEDVIRGDEETNDTEEEKGEKDTNKPVKILNYEDYSSKTYNHGKRFRRRKGNKKKSQYTSPILKIPYTSSEKKRKKGGNNNKKNNKVNLNIKEVVFVENDRRSNKDSSEEVEVEKVEKEEEVEIKEEDDDDEKKKKKKKKKKERYQLKRERLNKKILSSCTNNPERDLQGLSHHHHINPSDNMEFDEILFHHPSPQVSSEEEKEEEEEEEEEEDSNNKTKKKKKGESDDLDQITEDKHKKLINESREFEDIDLSSSTEELLEEVRRSPDNQEKQRMMNFQNIKFPSFLIGKNTQGLNINDPNLSKNQRMCLEFVNKRVKKKKLRLKKTSKESKRRRRRKKEMDYIRDEYEFFSSEDENDQRGSDGSESEEEFFYDEQEEKDGNNNNSNDDEILLSVRGILPSIGGVRQPFKHYSKDEFHRQQIRIVSDLPSFKISSSNNNNNNNINNKNWKKYRSSVSHPQNSGRSDNSPKKRGSVILSADIAPQTKVQKVRSRSARNVIASNDASSKLENYQNGWTKDFLARKKRRTIMVQKKRLRSLNKSWKKNLDQNSSYFRGGERDEFGTNKTNTRKFLNKKIVPWSTPNSGRKRNPSGYSFAHKSLKVDLFGNKLYT